MDMYRSFIHHSFIKMHHPLIKIIHSSTCIIYQRTSFRHIYFSFFTAFIHPTLSPIQIDDIYGKYILRILQCFLPPLSANDFHPNCHSKGRYSANPAPATHTNPAYQKIITTFSVVYITPPPQTTDKQIPGTIYTYWSGPSEAGEL